MVEVRIALSRRARSQRIATLSDCRAGPSPRGVGARITAALLPALCALGAGCISQTLTPYQGDSRARLAQVALPARPATAHPGIAEVPVDGTTTHAVLHLYRPKICSNTDETELGAIAYVSRAPGPKRWVVVLPIWGSSTYPPRKVARWVLTGPHGDTTNVLWIQGREGLVRYDVLKHAATEAAFLAEVSRTAACIDAAAEDVRIFLDWIVRRPDTDPRRVGIVGFSLGAAVASLVMGRDPRISTGVFVMVGGHLDEILATCHWEEREVREHAMAAFGWSLDQLKQAIQEPLAVVDPVLVAVHIGPANVLFVDSGYDTCIPRSARDDLWVAMGRPERVTLGYDHKNSFLTMTFLGFDSTTRRIVGFLDSRLTGPEHPTAPAQPTAEAVGRSH
jgi:dienelactone hydrolase